MRQKSLLSAIRIAAVLLMFSAARTFGGFTDRARAAEIVAPTSLNEQTVVNNDDQPATQKLTFDLKVNATEQSPGAQVQLVKPMAVEMQPADPAVTAPLPDALLPGILMITATFIATRYFKRRLV